MYSQLIINGKLFRLRRTYKVVGALMDTHQHSLKSNLVLCVGQQKSGTSLLYSQFLDQNVNLNIHESYRDYNLTSSGFDFDRYITSFRSTLYSTFVDVDNSIYNIHCVPLQELKNYFNIKVIYTVRDPIEQFKSHYSMSHENGYHTDANMFRHEQNLIEWLEHFDTFCLFLEDLQLEKLQQWLGFTINLNRNIVNPGKKIEMDVNESFESTYSFFNKKYGKKYIKSIWPNAI